MAGTAYNAVPDEVGPCHHGLATVERKALDATRTKVAAYLVVDWKLLPILGEPIEQHYDSKSAPEELKPLVRMFHLAGLCAEVFMDKVAPQIIHNATDYTRKTFGIDEQILSNRMVKIGANTHTDAKIFEVPIGDQLGYDQILAKVFEEPANTDTLAGIANQKCFAQKLRDAFARTYKFMRPLSPRDNGTSSIHLVNENMRR